MFEPRQVLLHKAGNYNGTSPIALVRDRDLGEFQGSCRLAIQACYALDFEEALSYSGLRQTTRMGSQLRVFPDQRSGWRRRAAA